jgi:hypothetical protein
MTPQYYLGEVNTPRGLATICQAGPLASEPVQTLHKRARRSRARKPALKQAAEPTGGPADSVQQAKAVVAGIVGALAAPKAAPAKEPELKTHAATHYKQALMSGPKPIKRVAAKLAAPLHPGFPQAGPIPTREDMRRQNEILLAQQQQVAVNQALASQKPQVPAPSKPLATCYTTIDLTNVVAEVTRRAQAREEQFRSEMRAELESQLNIMRIELEALKLPSVPSRSGPAATLQRPVRDISPPLEADNAQVKKKAVAPAAAESTIKGPGGDKPAPTNKPSQNKSGQQSPAQSAARKSNKPAAAPTHQMATRHRPVPQVAMPINTINRFAVLANTASWQSLKGGQPLKDLLAAKTPKTGKITRRASTKPVNRAAAATVAAACLLANAASAHAELVTGASSSSMAQQGTDWCMVISQVMAGLTLYVVAKAAQSITRQNLCLSRLVRVQSAALGAVWFAQVAGLLPTVSQIWQAQVQEGWAAPTFVIAGLCLMALAIFWRQISKSLAAEAACR